MIKNKELEELKTLQEIKVDIIENWESNTKE